MDFVKIKIILNNDYFSSTNPIDLISNSPKQTSKLLVIIIQKRIPSSPKSTTFQYNKSTPQMLLTSNHKKIQKTLQSEKNINL